MQNPKNSPGLSPIEILPLSKGQRILIGVSIVYSVCYFIWRGLYSVDTVVHPEYSWTYFAFDAFGFVSSLFFIASTYRIRKRGSIQPERTYSVDVFIPTINEGVELLRNTVSHALKMDYPHETYLLDDGRRPEVEALAREMGVGYITRSDNRGAKAGNLNHALSKTRGELIALFDADGIPRMDFLSKLVGYFNDQKVALVQTPNAFYNLDSFQHWTENSGKSIWHEQSLWYDVILRGLDYGNASTWCGSGSLFRREAFEKIGGVPTTSVTEDTLATLKLHQAGYDTVYHDEPIAFSLAPDSIEPYLVQRGRWALGSIQILRDHFFRILFSAKLNWAKKKSYFLSLYYFTAIQKVLYYTAPFAFLCLDISPVVEPDIMSLPMLGYVILSTWVFKTLARGTGRVYRNEVYFMHLIPVYLKAIALGLIPFFRGKFKVTPKSHAGEIPFHLWVGPVMVFLVSALAVGAGVSRYLNGEELGLAVIVSVGVAAYYLLISLGALLYFDKQPVSYESSSFFDYRPLRLTSVGGNPHVDEALGISFMVSETAVEFIHKGSFPEGERITLDLELPALALHLSGTVTGCRIWNEADLEPLHIIHVRLDSLDREAKQHLSLYFFEHATPKVMETTAKALSESMVRFSEANQKRQSERSPTIAPVVIETADGSGSRFGLLMDVSTGGALLSMPSALEPGSQIQVRLPWTKSEVYAEVIRCQKGVEQIHPTFLIGVRFNSPAEMESKYLSRFYQVVESGAVKIRVG